jgi:hypothetical protein
LCNNCLQLFTQKTVYKVTSAIVDPVKKNYSGSTENEIVRDNYIIINAHFIRYGCMGRIEIDQSKSEINYSGMSESNTIGEEKKQGRNCQNTTTNLLICQNVTLKSTLAIIPP